MRKFNLPQRRDIAEAARQAIHPVIKIPTKEQREFFKRFDRWGFNHGIGCNLEKEPEAALKEVGLQFIDDAMQSGVFAAAHTRNEVHIDAALDAAPRLADDMRRIIRADQPGRWSIPSPGRRKPPEHTLVILHTPQGVFAYLRLKLHPNTILKAAKRTGTFKENTHWMRLDDGELSRICGSLEKIREQAQLLRPSSAQEPNQGLLRPATGAGPPDASTLGRASQKPATSPRGQGKINLYRNKLRMRRKK